MSNKLSIIITGCTGMVGEGVLHVCLENPLVEKILIINRRSVGIKHLKLTEVILPNFFDLSSIENKLSGYNACFFCLGVSSVGTNKEEYYKTTYTLTMNFAETLCRQNNYITFIYVSGGGTDSTEKGWLSWARVKGKTENDLMKLSFKQVFAYRPGFIKPIKGLKYTHSFYKYINWFFPIGRLLHANGFITMQELALSMINISLLGYHKTIINGSDIIVLANKKLPNTQ